MGPEGTRGRRSLALGGFSARRRSSSFEQGLQTQMPSGLPMHTRALLRMEVPVQTGCPQSPWGHCPWLKRGSPVIAPDRQPAQGTLPCPCWNNSVGCPFAYSLSSGCCRSFDLSSPPHTGLEEGPSPPMRPPMPAKSCHPLLGLLGPLASTPAPPPLSLEAPLLPNRFPAEMRARMAPEGSRRLCFTANSFLGGDSVGFSCVLDGFNLEW